MTNQITVPVLEFVASTNNPQIMNIVCDGWPIWQVVVRMLLMLLLPIAPLLSISLCFRAWRLQRKGRRATWAMRIVLIAALLTFTSTAVQVLGMLRDAYFLAGTSVAAQVMLRVSISHACEILLIGGTASFLCLLCALCLPVTNSNGVHTNTYTKPLR
jgi:hypothetical protein